MTNATHDAIGHCRDNGTGCTCTTLTLRDRLAEEHFTTGHDAPIDECPDCTGPVPSRRLAVTADVSTTTVGAARTLLVDLLPDPWTEPTVCIRCHERPTLDDLPVCDECQTANRTTVDMSADMAERAAMSPDAYSYLSDDTGATFDDADLSTVDIGTVYRPSGPSTPNGHGWTSADRVVRAFGRVEQAFGIASDLSAGRDIRDSRTPASAMAERYLSERGADPYPYPAGKRSTGTYNAVMAARADHVAGLPAHVAPLPWGVSGPVVPMRTVPLSRTLSDAIVDHLSAVDADRATADAKREGSTETVPLSTLSATVPLPMRAHGPVLPMPSVVKGSIVPPTDVTLPTVNVARALSGPGTVRSYADHVARTAVRRAHGIGNVWSSAERESRRNRATVRAGRITSGSIPCPQWSSQSYSRSRIGRPARNYVVAVPTGTLSADRVPVTRDHVVKFSHPITLTRADGTTVKVTRTGRERTRRIDEREAGLIARGEAVGYVVRTDDHERTMTDLSAFTGGKRARARSRILDAVETAVLVAEAGALTR